jgi:FHS family L-fucose permease-like MFS transporter
MNTTTSTSTLAGAQTRRSPFALITAFFFIFGFLTCLNDILVPHLKSLFTLSYTESTLVQLCFFSAYFFMSIPSGKIVARIGYPKGMILGLGIAAVGALGFAPAAELRSYPVFLGALFVLASGITLLQVSVNPYVTALGPVESSARRLVLAQAFNSLGTAIAPLLGASLILTAVAENRASTLQHLYVIFAIALSALAAVAWLYRFPNAQEESDSGAELTKPQSRALTLGALGIFCYVGAEVTIGSFLVSWMGDSRLGSINAATAGKYLSIYWSLAMVGRFIGTALMTRLAPARLLAAAAVGSLALTITTMLVTGTPAVAAILSVGLFNSIMFPTIFSLTVERLPGHGPKASGILCTAIVGGAVFPVLQGVLADHVALRWSFIIPAVGYAYILYFARESAVARSAVRTGGPSQGQPTAVPPPVSPSMKGRARKPVPAV